MKLLKEIILEGTLKKKTAINSHKTSSLPVFFFYTYVAILKKMNQKTVNFQVFGKKWIMWIYNLYFKYILI